MEIILYFIASVSIIGQFFIDYIFEDKSRKRKIGIVLIGLAFISIWSSFYLQNKDNIKRDSNFNKLTIQNDSLQIKLGIMQNSNDSLLINNRILENLLTDVNMKISDLKIETIKGLSQSINKIETIGKASGARIISEIDKKKMISILNDNKGHINLVLTTNDQEVVLYAEQLKSVFRSAGWKTNLKYNYVMENPPLHGLKVIFKNRDNPPIGLIEAVRALAVIGEFDNKIYLFPEGEGSQRLQEIIYIRIGYK